MISSKDNKWLIVNKGVILTPIIEPVITSLDKYFEEAKLKASVTSGLRDAKAQLEVIRHYLIRKGLDKKYPHAMVCQVDDFGLNEYAWQMAWSNLLNIGVIINPPIRAKVLMNYIKDGINKNGQYINQTPHAAGTAFNIGGGGNGVQDEAKVITKALENKLPGLVSFLIERENNAIHCNTKKV